MASNPSARNDSVGKYAPILLPPMPRYKLPEDYRFFKRPVPLWGSRVGSNIAPSLYTRDLAMCCLSVPIAIGTAAFAFGALSSLPIPRGLGLGGGWFQLKAVAGSLWGALSGHTYASSAAWQSAVAAGGLPAMAAVSVKAALAAVVGSIPGALAFKQGWTPVDGNIHVSGRLLLEGKASLDELERLANNAIGGDKLKKDVCFHPCAHMPTAWLAGHGMVYGPPGSGKTAWMLHPMDQIIRSNHRMLAFDPKGDFTQFFYKEDPVTGKELPENRVALFAPFDKRSVIWDMARDVETREDAIAFIDAHMPQPEGQNAMFVEYGRLLVIGCIHMLQVEKPRRWTPGDLAGLLSQTKPEVFVNIMKQYNPEALKGVETADVTAAGVLSNMTSGMSIVFRMAEAWPERVKGRMFSFKEWLMADDAKLSRMRKKTVLIKGDAQFKDLTNKLAGSIFQIVSQCMCSSQLPDDITGKRRIYLMIDEAASLKVDYYNPIKLARSKGGRVWLLMQSPKQLKEIMKAEEADSIVNAVSTFLSFGALGNDADWTADLVGKRTVERVTNTGSGQSSNTNITRDSFHTIEPSQISLLGPMPGGKGVKGLLWGKNFPDAHLLHFPFWDRPKVQARPVVLAEYTQASYAGELMKVRAKYAEDTREFLRKIFKERMEVDYDKLLADNDAGAAKDELAESETVSMPKRRPPSAPNHMDPSKPFVSSNPGDAETTNRERLIWAKLKKAQMDRIAGESDGDDRGNQDAVVDSGLDDRVPMEDDDDDGDDDDRKGSGRPGGGRAADGHEDRSEEAKRKLLSLSLKERLAKMSEAKKTAQQQPAVVTESRLVATPTVPVEPESKHELKAEDDESPMGEGAEHCAEKMGAEAGKEALAAAIGVDMAELLVLAAELGAKGAEMSDGGPSQGASQRPVQRVVMTVQKNK